MEIREPRYKVGDKVYCKQYESSATITGVSDYSFNKDKFFYNVEWECDDYLDEIHEDLLEPYIEKPKSVWELKDGDECFFITSAGNILDGAWDKLPAYIGHRNTGNCFLIKEEAEKELERRKVETEMLRLGGRRKFKKGEDNYYIACDFGSNDYIFIFNNNFDCFGIGAIYFDSTKECEKAIETIGEDRIKKYYFGVDA